ncbi:MAG: hypothetical protein ACXQS6_00250 [Candidatus Syntropharchaeales archaeon]
MLVELYHLDHGWWWDLLDNLLPNTTLLQVGATTGFTRVSGDLFNPVMGAKG